MSTPRPPRISIVTPTLGRPAEVDELLGNLAALATPVHELVLVDAGLPEGDLRTAEVVARRAPSLPFPVLHLGHARGTAIQRNAGIDRASGDFVAFIDDDIRLEPDFFAVLLELFARDASGRVGGIVGYRTNEGFSIDGRARWRAYKRLGLLTTFEAGRYDYETGYPINAALQPPFTGAREIDFMNSSNAMWRREVFDQGLRFDPFFRAYGVLEDAHLSLSAKKRGWTLLHAGDAHCVHLRSPNARSKRRVLGYKSVVNYWYVFESVAGPLTPRQRFRFWRFQAFELLRLAASGVRRREVADLQDILGRLEGAADLARGRHLEP